MSGHKASGRPRLGRGRPLLGAGHSPVGPIAVAFLVVAGAPSGLAQDRTELELQSHRERLQQCSQNDRPESLREVAREAVDAARRSPSSPLSGEVLYVAARIYRTAGDLEGAKEAARHALRVGGLSTRFWAAKFMSNEIDDPEARLEGGTALLAIYGELAAEPPHSPLIEDLGGARAVQEMRVGDLSSLALSWMSAGRPDRALPFAEQAERIAAAADLESYSLAASTLQAVHGQLQQTDDAVSTLDRLWQRRPEEFRSELDYRVLRAQSAGLEGRAYVDELERILQAHGQAPDVPWDAKGCLLRQLTAHLWLLGRNASTEEERGLLLRAVDHYAAYFGADGFPEDRYALPLSISERVLSRLYGADSMARIGRTSEALRILEGLWSRMTREELASIDSLLMRKLREAAALWFRLKRSEETGEPPEVDYDDLYVHQTLCYNDEQGNLQHRVQLPAYERITREDVETLIRQARTGPGSGERGATLDRASSPDRAGAPSAGAAPADGVPRDSAGPSREAQESRGVPVGWFAAVAGLLAGVALVVWGALRGSRRGLV